MRRTAALIVGGGPAGSAAAIALARGGLKPLIFERDRETGDALCGGFLSWRTLDVLARLGVDREQLGGAPVDRVRVFAGERRAEARLPGPAVGVSRRRLDSLLLTRAEQSGAQVERGVRVTAAEGATVRTGDNGVVEADSLFLATGKHELRGLARPPDSAGCDPALGLRVRLAPANGLATLIGPAIELHLFDRGYAGLVIQEDGSANLCMAVRKSRLTDSGGKPRILLDAIGRECPALGERLSWLGSDAPVDAIGWVPYGWRARSTEPGVFRIGDQAGVIASLAGEGVGIAIASGDAAARALLRDGRAGAPAFQRKLAIRLATPVASADLLKRLAERPTVARGAVTLLERAPALLAPAARLTRFSI